ncbi:beta-ketoadipyl CoA thiolase [Bdellovibrio bacteriovorus]|uniref:Beta-ketoadipyl CoA thiolase n=1 Tax=Bdellovibrio bacteriovorus TaxID=959 RepID=A0A150WRD2_BDEBC|nr:acetyl-CoA C-acetyltransferase [Bdellovibrio bacteriovorus]KYG67061.1 beta-ketoadipyl CoA thiolase [Bdellovibrio bacteriovorus]
MENIVFIAGKRTPFGAFGGSLKDVSGTELTVVAAKATLEQAGVSADKVDHVIIGNVVQSGADAAYLPRHVGLKSGVPVGVGALGVNRLCGSGFQSWVDAVQMIRCGDASIVLAGGVEQMSQIPYVARKVRFDGMRMGNFELEDLMTSALTDAYAKMPMAITAENLGEKYGITREQCDKYAIQTQTRFKAALDKGYFAEEITPVTVEGRKGTVVVDKDEHPKPDSTLEKLATLKSLFKKEGLVTAATASGIVDGAACSLLMSESKAKSLGLKPLARIVSYASVGCDPTIMGIGPAGAARMALDKAGLKLEQMDLVEVNEAFAAQYLAVEKELKLNPEKTNVNGGAIAVGHPLGASGTRIMNHLVYELHRRSGKYALGSACIGGGQGIAIIIEKM